MRNYDTSLAVHIERLISRWDVPVSASSGEASELGSGDSHKMIGVVLVSILIEYST